MVLAQYKKRKDLHVDTCRGIASLLLFAHSRLLLFMFTVSYTIPRTTSARNILFTMEQVFHTAIQKPIAYMNTKNSALCFTKSSAKCTQSNSAAAAWVFPASA